MKSAKVQTYLRQTDWAKTAKLTDKGIYLTLKEIATAQDNLMMT